MICFLTYVMLKSHISLCFCVFRISLIEPFYHLPSSPVCGYMNAWHFSKLVWRFCEGGLVIVGSRETLIVAY
jgi:hypothetical protein